MPGRKEKTPVNTPEVHFDYLVNQFDEIVFGLRRQSLINLLVIASDGNKQAQKFVDIINALNLNGKLSNKPEGTNNFGHCPGHGRFVEIEHQNVEPKIEFRCDRCTVVKKEDKPPVLVSLEGMGLSWNYIHFPPQEREEK
jgi:hypothetical protein